MTFSALPVKNTMNLSYFKLKERSQCQSLHRTHLIKWPLFHQGHTDQETQRERQTALRMQEIQINSFNFTHEQTGRLMSKTLHCAPALGSDFKGWCHAEHSAQTARCYKNTGKVTFLTENKTSNRTKIRAESLKLISVTFSRN